MASLSWNTLDRSVEPEMFKTSHEREDCIMLWTVADKLPGLTKFVEDVMASDGNLSARWDDIPCQTLESRRFSSSIYTEQCEALSIV